MDPWEQRTELGLKGFEIMRMIKLGVFDFAYGLGDRFVALERGRVIHDADRAATTRDDLMSKVSV